MSKKKLVIICIVILIIVLLITTIALITTNNSINKIEEKDTEALDLTDGVTIEVKNMASGKIYCLLKFTENTGIKQITYPDSFTIYANNRNTISIDYVIDADTDYEFRVTNGEGDTRTRIVRKEYDNMPPEKAIIEFDNKKVDIYQTINATVTQSDLYIGIDTTKCKYIINNSEEEIGVDSSTWNSATVFSSNPQKVGITESERGGYYLHVLSIDRVGNKTETVSERIFFQGEVTYLKADFPNTTRSYGPSRNSYITEQYDGGWTISGGYPGPALRANSGSAVSLITNNPVDLSETSTLTLNSNFNHDYGTTGGGIIYFGISETKSAVNRYRTVSFTKPRLGGGKVSLEIDVSDLNDSNNLYYICVYVTWTAGEGGMYLVGDTSIIGK